MFAEELADLKNRYGPELQLVHVLSREPRDVDLFSGRLDADRLRRLLTTLVPAGRFDHVWLCGPHAMLMDAREVLAELGVPKERIHFELFYVDAPPPELHRADAVVEGETSEVTISLDGRTTTSPMPRAETILDGGRPGRATTCPSPARAACAAPAGRWSATARSTCAATTLSTRTRSSAASS